MLNAVNLKVKINNFIKIKKANTIYVFVFFLAIIYNNSVK